MVMVFITSVPLILVMVTTPLLLMKALLTLENGLQMFGIVFLESGEDYIKGSGNGEFYGGNGNDTLELTPGSYTVGNRDTSATFTKDGVRL
jgi:hypothetical protein